MLVKKKISLVDQNEMKLNKSTAGKWSKNLLDQRNILGKGIKIRKVVKELLENTKAFKDSNCIIPIVYNFLCHIIHNILNDFDPG